MEKQVEHEVETRVFWLSNEITRPLQGDIKGCTGMPRAKGLGFRV